MKNLKDYIQEGILDISNIDNMDKDIIVTGLLSDNKENQEKKLELDEVSQIIYDMVSVEARGFDEIQASTGLGTDVLLVHLTEMELSGLIEQVEGDRYKRG